MDVHSDYMFESGNRNENDIENRYGITSESKQWAAGYQFGFDCGVRVGFERGYAECLDDEAEMTARE